MNTPNTARRLPDELNLPYLEGPERQREISTFLTVLGNGEYGKYRTDLATLNYPEFERILGAERRLLFSADGSLPPEAPLTAEQQKDVRELYHLYCIGKSPKQSPKLSILSRIGAELQRDLAAFRNTLSPSVVQSSHASRANNLP